MCVYSHHSKVRGDAEGMRNMAYAALRCNRIIRMTFFHTMIRGGRGPPCSLYVASNTSSVLASVLRTVPLLLPLLLDL